MRTIFPPYSTDRERRFHDACGHRRERVVGRKGQTCSPKRLMAERPQLPFVEREPSQRTEEVRRSRVREHRVQRVRVRHVDLARDLFVPIERPRPASRRCHRALAYRVLTGIHHPDELRVALEHRRLHRRHEVGDAEDLLGLGIEAREERAERARVDRFREPAQPGADRHLLISLALRCT